MSETSKRRQARIDPSYYRIPDAQTRWRGRLTLLAMVIAGFWLAAAPMWGRGRDVWARVFEQSSLASKGPLARPHAMWEFNCEACHIPFTPVDGSRWSPSFLSDPSAARAPCQTCHAGPAHYANEPEPEQESCALCHRDHSGRDASLLAMDDVACTSCHRDLSGHANLKIAGQVTRFSADPAEHPAFTPPPGVPGPESKRIKFSHARHMASGLTTEQKGEAFTFASLKEEDRGRYGWTGGRDEEPIQLRCDSCHRLDRADAAVASPAARGPAGPRSAGHAMLPVTYENDCRACHALAFDPKDPERTVPHGLEPKQVFDQLKQFYTAQAVKADPDVLRLSVPLRPMPGRPASAEGVRAETAAADRTLVALRRLFGAAAEEGVRRGQGLPLGRGGCVECHELTPAAQPLVSLEAAATLGIKPVAVRSRWYESSVFNHVTHRAIECASCHAGTSQSKDQDDLLLPNAGQCVTCHAPATTRGGRPRGGAGTSCVECHCYHSRDHHAQGVGAGTRRRTAEMTVDQFLNGGPGRSELTR
jgi:predicted CXXCH cytochrome family protein